MVAKAFFEAEIDEAVLLRGLAASALERRDDTAALALCDRLIERRPDDAMGWAQRALQLTKLQRHEHAVDAYADAITRATAPTDSKRADPRGQLHFNRACELAKLSRKREALDDLRAAMKYEEKWGSEAKTDDYFAGLWEDPEFREVVG